MTKWLKNSFFLLIFMSLAGCGFSPLYMETDNSQQLFQTLSQVSLNKLGGRYGQVFTTSLEDKLAPFGPASSSQFNLQVTLNDTQEGYGFRLDEAVTRENSRLSVDYNLIDNSTGKVINSGAIRSDLAYDIVQSDFANTQVREDAIFRNIETASTRLATRLAIYFNNNPNTFKGSN